jgi:hypothetical protein
MPLRARIFAWAFLSALVLGTATASAQTVGGPTVTAAGQVLPERFVPDANGMLQDLGQATRPMNLHPGDISYSDCAQDMVLRFFVTVSGFTGQNLQIFATRSGQCTNLTDRGIGLAADCWIVNQGNTAYVAQTATTTSFDIRVQDLVGPQNAPPTPPKLTRWGPEACTAQPSFQAVPLTLYFLPLDSANNYVGSGYQYTINADLAGPPPPMGLGIADGDTLMVLSWTPNVDADTTGYDVFMDPIPGQEGNASLTPVSSSEPTYVCNEAGSAPTPTPDASNDSSADATTDSAAVMDSAATPVDSGCYWITKGGSPQTSGNCSSTVLTSGSFVQEGGVQTIEDDSGEGGVIQVGAGGISTIPSQYIVGANAGTGVSVSDKATGTMTVKGLKNQVTYNVAVSAVDGYGNVGPPSALACDYPAPVNDFWDSYRNAGGGAGGGFCALQAVGAPAPSLAGLALVVSAGVLARRRRRGRSA